MQSIPNIVQEVNNVFIWIIGIDVALLALITFLMIYFVIKYNKKRHPKAEQVEEHPMLEIIWTVTPTLLVLGMFYYGYVGYEHIRTVPPNAFTVKVIGQQWQWRFEYPNGKSSDKLYVPMQTPIKCLLYSNDVIHGFYIPAFRIKRDCVPGMENYIWFMDPKEGTEDIFCTQYCGLYHAGMISKVVSMNQKDFDKWYTTVDIVSTQSIATTSLSVQTTAGAMEHMSHDTMKMEMKK